MNLQSHSILLINIVLSIGRPTAFSADAPIFHWSNQRNGQDELATTRNISRREATDPTFYGHPKSQQEKWHQSFQIEKINPQTDMAEQLVTLLNKVVNKYLSACAAIVIYDKYVEQTDSIILQTFFQVDAC